ncbi:MYNN protein, partial [Amia calva]|nr:MYNN protein [Amia calva]
MQPPHHCQHLLDQLNKQREAGFLCDCTIVVGQSQFRAHRNVLAAFSEFFSLQWGNPAENGVTFLDPVMINEEGFEKLLDFMYTGEMSIDSCKVTEVHKAATFLKMEAAVAWFKLKLGSVMADVKPSFRESMIAERETDAHMENEDLPKASEAKEMPTTEENQELVLLLPGDTERYTQGLEKTGRKARKPKNTSDGTGQQRRSTQQKERRQLKSGSQPLQGEAFSDASNKTTPDGTGQGAPASEELDSESLAAMDNGGLADQSTASCKLSLKRGKAQGLADKQLKTKPMCNTCGKVFSEASSLRRHMRIHKGVKPYVCQLCGKAFTQCNQLKTHVRTHTGEKPYQCDLCDKGFAQKCQLVFHSRMHHGEEKPYKCDICGLQFATSSNLKIHARKHSGEKPYVCDRCGQSFAQASTLTYHVRRHTGEKPYICDTCGKAFAVSSSLITHARKHTGEKPYMCRTCGKSFISSGELNKHCRSHTGEKPFVCELCGNSYTDVKNLKKHKAKAHGVEKSLDPSSSSAAFEEGEALQKVSLPVTVELKSADIPLSLTIPVASEEHQMLLSGTDNSSIPSDQLLRSAVTGYSEPQFIFLQQLY